MTKLMTPEWEPLTREELIRYIKGNDPDLQEKVEQWQKCRDFVNDLERWAEYRKHHPLHLHSTKERPRCRAWISKEGLTPYPSVDAWDGFSAVMNFMGDDPPLPMRTFLSAGLRAAMRDMLIEGFYEGCGYKDLESQCIAFALKPIWTIVENSVASAGARRRKRI